MKYFVFLISAIIFCIGNVFAADSLSIKTQTFSGTVPRNGVNIPFLKVSLTATGTSNVRVTELDVHQTGLSSASDVMYVRAITSSARSIRTSVGNDGMAQIRFLSPVTIIAGKTVDFTITADLKLAGFGRTVGFELVDVKSDVLSRPKISGSIPRQSSTYDVTQLQFDSISTGSVINFGEDRIGRFRLSNPGKKDITVQNITLKNNGTADMGDTFDTITLRQNGMVISRFSSAYKKLLSFQLNNFVVPKGRSVILEVWANAVRPHDNDTVELVLQDQADLGAQETTGVTVPVQTNTKTNTASFVFQSSPLLIKKSAFSGGASTLWNSDYSPGSRDVVFLDTYVTSKSPIYVDDVLIFRNAMSSVSDKNGNGIANESADFEATFGEFTLYVDGQREETVNSFSNDVLSFRVGERIYGSVHFVVRGRIKDAAVNGDRLKLEIDKDRSFPGKESL